MRFLSWFAVAFSSWYCVSLATAQLSAPIVNVEGVGNYADNSPVAGSINVPPDTVGSVGPNHYVQATNVVVKIFDKNGIVLNTLPLSNFWNDLGGECANNNGDPDVLYDQFEDRFIITQFTRTDPNILCMAVSKGSDPDPATGGVYWVRCCTSSVMFLTQYIVCRLTTAALYLISNTRSPTMH